jgi:hypothetical protein
MYNNILYLNNYVENLCWESFACVLCLCCFSTLRGACRCLGSLAAVLKWRRPVKDARLSQARQAHTLADLPALVYPLITYIGPHLSADTILIIKLLRIGRFILERVRYSIFYCSILCFGCISRTEWPYLKSAKLCFLVCFRRCV